MGKKVYQKCIWCGLVFECYPSARRKFCSSHCHYQHASKANNPLGYTRHPHLSAYNREVNPTRMTAAVREKVRIALLGRGEGKSYVKFYGRHLHRVVAEQKLGRKLRQAEIVHHVDGNHRNNIPDNLMVLPDQRAHARLHFEGKNNANSR